MFKLPRYNSPTVQIVLVALVCFATVGMFLALLNLGAGGTQNIKLSDTTNAVLYGLFALTGLVAGSINNILGPRLTLFCGSIGYAVYVTGLWVYQTKAIAWYLVLSGAILGVGAGLLWAAQGAIMMAYPLEKDKGRMFSMFWMIFNVGSLLGSLIALGIDVSQGAMAETATSIYAAFFAIIVCGVALTWALLPPGRVVRNDGSIVRINNFATPKEEILGMWRALKTKEMLLLSPMCFRSNYFYSYQGALAFAQFDAETRALNGVVSALGQILGAAIVGLLLDAIPVRRRRNRGMVGLLATTAFIVATYGWGLKFQLGFTRETKLTKLNFTSPGFAEPITILILYSVGDAMFQGMAYWTMGALTNDAFVLARFAGLYKAFQASGSAISFGVDAAQTPYLNEQLSSGLLLIFALMPASYVVWHVADSHYDDEPVVHVGDTLVDNNGRVLHAGEKSTDREVGLNKQTTEVVVLAGADDTALDRLDSSGKA